jgi:hypothetical protein
VRACAWFQRWRLRRFCNRVRGRLVALGHPWAAELTDTEVVRGVELLVPVPPMPVETQRTRLP